MLSLQGMAYVKSVLYKHFFILFFRIFYDYPFLYKSENWAMVNVKCLSNSVKMKDLLKFKV